MVSKGPALDAIVASASIPGVFPPRLIGDRVCVDGGVAYNAPISVAARLGATRVVVAPTGYTCAAGPHSRRGAFGTLLQALVSMMHRQLVIDIERLHEEGIEVRTIPPLCPLGIFPHDFSRTMDLIRGAEATTTAWLEQGGLEAPSEIVPYQLRAHVHGEVLRPGAPFLQDPARRDWTAKTPLFMAAIPRSIKPAASKPASVRVPTVGLSNERSALPRGSGRRGRPLPLTGGGSHRELLLTAHGRVTVEAPIRGRGVGSGGRAAPSAPSCWLSNSDTAESCRPISETSKTLVVHTTSPSRTCSYVSARLGALLILLTQSQRS